MLPPHLLFRALAEDRPERPAVECGEERLSYDQLDAWADAIATELRDAGVGPDAVVGISLPRRPAIIAAILGVHRAGGAYLPLDPAHPIERRRFMVEDAGAVAVIAEPGLATDLQNVVPVVPPARPSAAAANSSDWAPPDPHDLAYVMYTSGSTGRPKGVMIEHRSLAAFVGWGLDTFSPTELEAVLLSTSLGFDISAFEIFVPICAGGRIVLEENLLALRDGRGDGITLINTVPSPMAALLSEATLPSSVQTVILAGEPLTAELAGQVHRQPSVRRLVNAYGPTEDTIYSTYAEVPSGVRPSIGRPLPGTSAYVVDADLQPVADGEAGELILGGPKLARGYVGLPDLTGERFVPNPVPGDGPDRVYRTGDLALFEADGSLTHLGRIDDQIKLHGVRIEPGEIEDALLRHENVRQAAVIARERAPGKKQLVAYVVPEEDAGADGRALRAYLRRFLPEVMVPSVYVPMVEMPLNPNGKLDRKRLPEPFAPSGFHGDAAETDTERRLAAIWTDLLELEAPPGRDDDYFELGGTSLLAFELCERVGTGPAGRLNPNVLVEASTIRALAARIDEGITGSGRLVQLAADGTQVPVMYVHAGAGGMLTLRSFTAGLGPDQPIFGLQAYPDERIEAGTAPSVADTAAECLAILRNLQPHGPYLIAGHSIGGHIAYEMACRLTSESEEVAFLGLLDPAAPHTQLPAGRLVARGKELAGRGPEGRRPGITRALLSGVRARLDPRRAGTTPDPGAEAEPTPDDVIWMRNLGLVERTYKPPRFRGDAVVYTTAEMARWTGDRSLGWQRHIKGDLHLCRVPGDHLSMLLAPNIDVLVSEMRTHLRAVQADLREADETGPGNGSGTSPARGGALLASGMGVLLEAAVWLPCI